MNAFDIFVVITCYLVSGFCVIFIYSWLMMHEFRISPNVRDILHTLYFNFMTNSHSWLLYLFWPFFILRIRYWFKKAVNDHFRVMAKEARKVYIDPRQADFYSDGTHWYLRDRGAVQWEFMWREQRWMHCYISDHADGKILYPLTNRIVLAINEKEA